MTQERVCVIGDGSWGTALALKLVEAGHRVTMWSAFPESFERLAKTRRNEPYLPGVELPAELHLSADPFEAADGVVAAVSVVPTQYLRATMARFEDALGGTVPIFSASKGLEMETLRRPTQILREVLGPRPLVVLTGPSHAEEVARGLPASVLSASEDAEAAELAQRLFSHARFRVYTSDDPLGAELAAAYKNVIALAAGIADGLELGDNAKAALVSRGMIEAARFGQDSGARPRTFFGLAGAGDLIATCFSQHSRNRRVGEAIGRGATLTQVLDDMQMVAEGVWTTRALFGPEREARPSDLPIAEQVHAVLFEERDPSAAVTALMERVPVGEMEGLELDAR
ncbi:Glycerol-3-phosphate dehydrogenase [NAD(P)+] [Planctomycetes bacterium Pla163]|jgi:glycerol-3-phosphate dehydrogenase (NAD(P)+)|uniref:Glycerol-3-phosphate dehydrogenase [NAD(P)+] n=1 Tax=Rohdeia mirabilis TaxID=2528008 RepID=A0A518CY17_9BACT|nr:Glycerol-3-phosphate dehydrogenase [NAD(P)+] [Planctomycetes bacterium Pla163]